MTTTGSVYVNQELQALNVTDVRQTTMTLVLMDVGLAIVLRLAAMEMYLTVTVTTDSVAARFVFLLLVLKNVNYRRSLIFKDKSNGSSTGSLLNIVFLFST